MDVAIVGAGCRLPGGVDSPEALWRLLCDGVDAVGEVPPERFDADALYHPDPANPGTLSTRWGGFVDGIDAFDADFFGISPREARRMDPQQRLLLEVAWEALEDGGQPPDRLAGSPTGVFVGVSTSDYAEAQRAPALRGTLDAYVGTGGALSIIANRVSYVLDLHGPSLVVDTACSSSLTALHLACRSLQLGECDLAIAGGVNVILTPAVTIMFSKASMLSPDGRCKSFDASANGYVRSEGAGAVVLKPLRRAVADGDPIYAVVKATSVNQDGRTAGIGVPNAAAQQELLRRALTDAGLEAGDVQYVEAHGTGTPVGDPLEAAAVGGVYGAGRPRERPCLVGSVKSNLGHMEAAAGIAGLLKTALALRHGRIPPNLHFDEPNPAIAFDELGLRVPIAAEPWPADPGKAVAGVNGFGFGGANAHAILAEAPPRQGPPTPAASTARLVPLSARTPEALRQLASEWLGLLGTADPPALADLSHTAALRRSHHNHRLAVVAASREELAAALGAYLAGDPHPGLVSGRSAGRAPEVAFVYSGMGAQWAGMGRRLLEDPVFRRTVEACDDALRPLARWSLLEELGGEGSVDAPPGPDREQVTNLALQLGLTALWRSWGITPDAVVGHSSGETAAACVAGALDLPDAVRLAFHRGRLLQRRAGAGGMLAAAIAPDAAEALIGGRDGSVCVAAVNAPTSVTLSGDVSALEEIAEALQAQGRWCRPLTVDVPYHSPQLDELEEELLASLADIRPGALAVPIVSTTTGTWADGDAFGPEHWWRNLREPVRFAAAVEELADRGLGLFVEMGAHPVLAHPLQESLLARERNATNATVVPTLRRDEDARRALLRALAVLHTHGRPVDWRTVPGTDGTCVRLPTYPWQRERHWIDARPDDGRRPRGVEPDDGQRPHEVQPDDGPPLPGRRLQTALPTWERDLGDPRLAYLTDHVVHGTPTFPGAGHVVLALAAADALGAEGALGAESPVALEDVAFSSLLPLQDREGTVLQCTLDPEHRTVGIHSGRRGADDSWQRRAEARLVDRTAAAPAADLDAIRRRCPVRVPPDRFYQTVEAALALDYRGAFRSLADIRSGDGEALARVAADDSLAEDGGPVHPALLDAAFQALVVAFGADGHDSLGAGVTVLPVGIARVESHGRLGARFWTHATVDRQEDGVLEGTVRLLDDGGDVALVCRGLRLKALDRSQADVADRIRVEVWEPARQTADGQGVAAEPAQIARAEPAQIARTVGGALEGLADATGFRDYYRDIGPALDAVSARLVARALAELGWDGRPANDLPADELAARLGIVERHRPFLRLLLALLRDVDPDGGLDEAQLEGHPRARSCLRLLRRSCERLAATLRGEEDPRTWLVAAQGDGALAEFYADSPPGRFYNAVLADAVAAARPPGAALRILEVGAGTGTTTAALLDRLGDDVDDYLFTDISPYFVKQARDRFGGRPEVRFAVLDAQQPEPDLDASFDVVVAADVIHATADVRTTLERLRRCLVPGGLLVLLEPVRRSLWLHLIFGQLEGWWSFTDTDLRTVDPLLDAARWRTALSEAGFAAVDCLADTPEVGTDPMQVVLVAQAPTDQRPAARTGDRGRRWVLLADRGGVAARLAAGLRGRGHRCTLVRPAGSYRRPGEDRVDLAPDREDHWARLLRDLAEEDAGPPDVLHLWGLDAAPTAALDTEALMAAQATACGAVVALLRAVHGKPSPLGSVWLVTAGAQPAGPVPEDVAMAQTPLWGLGRVVRNELGGGRCRLVDLSPDVGAAEVAALLDELVDDRSDAEPELVLRGPARHVRRLRKPVLTSSRPRRERIGPDRAALRLEIGTPGALESLRLVQPATPGPNSGDVEIRVHAAALNFRDVMVAMGMLGGDGRRRPFGLECAGVVLSCPGRGDLRPGDEVVAFANGAAGSRATTDAGLVTRKPPGLSFAQAAALPVAFATAHDALHGMGHIAPGERVLVHSASGGVGLAALQLCRRAGADVFATAGTPEKRAFLASLGVEHVMDSRSLDFADAVLDATGGEGVDVVLNTLVDEGRTASLWLLRRSGRFVDLAVRDMAEDKPMGLGPFARGLSYHSLGEGDALPPAWGDILRGVVGDVADGALQPLPCTTFDLEDADEAIRLMAQARHIGKVVLTVEEPHYWAEPPARPLFRPDATYLLVGGLGGFGIATARWMARRGARHLVLTSRSGRPRPEDADALEAIGSLGARVLTMRADAADEAAMHDVLAAVRATCPPLRGVVHAAMTLDDDLLGRLDQERFAAVLAPKVAGAWNLHRLTAEDDLDLFVLFSSLSSVLGVPTQGNYAAANAFLDALSAHRRSLGLPGLTVNWGALAGVGYVARHPDLQALSRRSAVRMMSTEVAFAGLERAIRSSLPRVVIGRVDWSRLSSDATVAPTGHTGTGTGEGRNGREDQRHPHDGAAAPRPWDGASSPDGLLQALVARTAVVLDTAPERIDAERSLADLGLDSLMAVELQAMVQRDLGVEVTLVELLEGLTLRQFADRIAAGASA